MPSGKRIDHGDLYQLFLYAYAYAPRDSDAPARSFILFPAHGSPRHDIRVRDANHATGARITALGIDLEAVLGALDRGEDDYVPVLAEITTQLGHPRASMPVSAASDWPTRVVAG